MHTTGNVGMIKVKGQHFDVEMSSYNVRGDTGHLAQPLINQQSAHSALDHCLPIAAGKSWVRGTTGQSLYRNN